MRGMSFFRAYELPTALLATLAIGAGCSEPRCPRGYNKRGDTCYRIRDSGQDASELEDEDDDSGLGGNLDPASRSDAGSDIDERDGGNAAALDATLDAASPGGADAALDAIASAIDTGAAVVQPDAGNGEASPDGAAVTRPCDSNPCQNDGICSPAGSAYTCGCPDGYTGMSCELEICGPTTIRTRDDVENNRLCAEIRGDLDISAVGLPSITASDFPFLTKVTGFLQIVGRHDSGAANLGTVTFAKLVVVEGAIVIGSNLLVTDAMAEGSGPLTELHLPALTTIGGRGVGGLAITQTSLRVLDLPALTTIVGDVSLYLLPELCSVNLRKVTSVDGGVRIVGVPRISSQLFAPIRNAAMGMVTQSLLGCCWTGLNERVSCNDFLTGCAGCRTQ
jgi:hypothetical protein